MLRIDYVSYQRFHVWPSTKKIIVELTKFPSQEAKIFPNKFTNIFVAQPVSMFPSSPHIFGRNTLFFRLRK